MKMRVQLDACAVLHLVIQNRALAGPTAGKDFLERRKFFVPAEDRIPQFSNPINF
jgi:hypothetical protein